jgi:hypothetical protein
MRDIQRFQKDNAWWDYGMSHKTPSQQVHQPGKPFYDSFLYSSHIYEGNFINCTNQSVWIGMPGRSMPIFHLCVHGQENIKSKEIIPKTKV